jgi:hypothetical protein
MVGATMIEAAAIAAVEEAAEEEAAMAGMKVALLLSDIRSKRDVSHSTASSAWL